MIVAIFRHGHKDFSTDFDPSLSLKGFEQAENLLQLLNQNALPKPTHLWFSDKKRTLQTIEKAQSVNTNVQIKKNQDLNLRDSRETRDQFRNRVEHYLTFLENRQNENEVHFACTHYDWLEEFLTVVNANSHFKTHDFYSWAPGQFVIFDVRDGEWNFQQKGVL